MILRKSPTADHGGLKLLPEGEENPALNSPSVIFGEKRQDHRSFVHFFFLPFEVLDPKIDESESSEVVIDGWNFGILEW